MAENNNTKTNHKTAKEETDWKDTALSMIKNFFENFFSELSKNIKQKIELFIIKLKNNLISLALVIVGMIFLAAGLAVMLNYLIGIPGLGYLIVGLVLVMFGMLFKMKK